MKTIEELKAAYAAATPGEWEHFDSPGMSPDLVFIGQHGVATLNGPEYCTNAHLIALMHNTLPALIECVEALNVLAETIEAGTSADYRALQEHSVMRTTRAALVKLEK